MFNIVIIYVRKKLVHLRDIFYILIDCARISNSDTVLFCDLGANVGGSYLFFKKFYKKNVTFYLFEPNLDCYKKLLKIGNSEKKKIHVKNVAASYFSGTCNFFRSSNDKLSEGGSINEDFLKDLRYSYQDKKEVTLIKTINFSNFLKKKSIKFNKVIVKMDIEGSELDLIKSLIKNNTVNIIDVLYVEFHSNYVKNSKFEKFKTRENKIISYIKNKTNITLRLWH